MQHAVKGAGTDEEQLSYATILFADECKTTIVAAYKELGYGDFIKELKGDTSGDYKDALLKLWQV